MENSFSFTLKKALTDSTINEKSKILCLPFTNLGDPSDDNMAPVFADSIGRTDFPGGNGALLKKSILELSKLDVDYLLPGHMGIIEGNENVKHNFQHVIKNIFPYI